MFNSRYEYNEFSLIHCHFLTLTSLFKAADLQNILENQ